MRSILAISCLGLLTLGFVLVRPATEEPRELICELHALSDVRLPQTFEARLLVHHPGEVSGALQLERIEVLSADGVLWYEDLDQILRGDPEYGDLRALIERLPHELAHRHGIEQEGLRRFAREDAPEFSLVEGLDAIEVIRGRLAALRESMATGQNKSVLELPLLIPGDLVLAKDAAVGEEAELEVRLSYRTGAGAARATSSNHTLRKIAAFAPLPPGLSMPGADGLAFHAGDLHVHSCHGEAIGACSPSDNCEAETFQLSGAFSFAALKGQYQALGLDWFTATDHSYCVDEDNEFAAVVNECNAITDAAFVAIPDLELSSEEQGSQSGSDTADLLCLLGPEANHMGAHGITSRLYGGDSGLLGFCNGLFSDALNGFLSNIAAVRGQGGYVIANHPAAGEFGWNSRSSTVGQEASGIHGVEIWNGASASGQGSHVGAWVDWLLAGRRMYAYSGSDTHDEAFAFGANRVLIEGNLTKAKVEEAVRAGRNTISNGPGLVLQAKIGGIPLLMGTVQHLPTQVPSQPVVVEALFDTGGVTGTVTIFRGEVGAASEAILVNQIGQSGTGVVQGNLTLTNASRQWVRAYFQSNDGTGIAYTNPIFFERAPAGSTSDYCIARPDPVGCEPSIAWGGAPSASGGLGFVISASDIRNQTFGIPVWSLQSSHLPFFGGILCVGNPLKRGAVQATGGNPAPADCSGTLWTDFNTVIASGVDPNLTVGTTVHVQFWYRNVQAVPTVGLTNAVQFTIQP